MLNRFDGYPDLSEPRERPRTVLEMYNEVGYDPADDMEEPDENTG